MRYLLLSITVLACIFAGFGSGWFVRDSTETIKDLRREHNAQVDARDGECVRLIKVLDPIDEAQRDFKSGNLTPIGLGAVYDFGSNFEFPETTCKNYDWAVVDADYPKDGKRLHFRGSYGVCGATARKFAGAYNRRMSQLAPAQTTAFCHTVNAKIDAAEKLQQKTVRPYHGIM